MKVRDSAMGQWFAQLTPEQASMYCTKCLYEGSDNVFWDIVKFYDLRAKTPLELGSKVVEHLMEFDLDNVGKTQGEE
jgi:hypothetical protein